MNLPWNKKRELVICPSKANQSTSELHVCLGYRSKAEAASRGETHFNLNLPIILSLFIYLFISLFIRALSCPTDITTESRGTPPSVPSLRMNTNLPPLFPPFEFIQPQKKKWIRRFPNHFKGRNEIKPRVSDGSHMYHSNKRKAPQNTDPDNVPVPAADPSYPPHLTMTHVTLAFICAFISPPWMGHDS